MPSLLFISLLLFSLSLCASSDSLPPSESSQQKEGDFTVFGYLPEWRTKAFSWAAAATRLTHVILFSLEIKTNGRITELERLPPKDVIADIRKTMETTGLNVLLCFGGNGRSDGFSIVARRSKPRKRFLSELAILMTRMRINGVDLNWEYPGYRFGRGYLPDVEVENDYEGFRGLIEDMRKTFDDLSLTLGYRLQITLAYYPDGRQEELLSRHGILDLVDHAHTMAYDAPGGNHAPLSLAHKVIQNAKAHSLPLHKITLGVPFYGRDVRTGDWKTYEDIVGTLDEKRAAANEVVIGGETIGYNGIDMIREKASLAVDAGLGGLMIWEVGQDCRIEEVIRGDDVHKVTCPDVTWSLLEAIDQTLKDKIGEEWRGWLEPQFLRPSEESAKPKEEL